MDDMQLGSRNAYMWKNPVMGGTGKTLFANKFACLENINFEDKRMPLQLSG